MVRQTHLACNPQGLQSFRLGIRQTDLIAVDYKPRNVFTVQRLSRKVAYNLKGCYPPNFVMSNVIVCGYLV